MDSLNFLRCLDPLVVIASGNSAISFFEGCGFEIIDLYSNEENGEIHVFCKKNTEKYHQNKGPNKFKEFEELSKDVSLMIKKLNQNKEKFLNNIKKDNIKEKLKNLTSEAFEKDIFGAPTFVVNNKIFWGQDRLDYALDEYNS